MEEAVTDEYNDRQLLLAPSDGGYGAINQGNIQDSILPVDREDLDDTHSISAALFQRRDRVAYRACNRRWYILIVFWLLSFIQATLWNTWAPITASTEKAYDMDDGDISLMENWNNITYTMFIFPFIWFVQRRGLRLPMVVTASLMVVGAFVRCLLYWDLDTCLVVINIGQFLIGISGPVAFFSCTAISATWFPPQQRTLATALMSVAQSGGIAFSFVVGPEVVKALTKDPSDVESLRFAIQRLLYGEFVASALILIAVIIYFPSKPPLPPCESAAQQRLGFLKSLKSMCSSPNALMIFTVYGISAGIFSGWFSLLAMAVRDTMAEIEAGWLGCWMTVAGIGASLIAGFLGDRFPKLMKLQIIVMLVVAGSCFTYFTLTCNEVEPVKYDSLGAWITCIVGGAFAAAIQPICYELANEAVFPAPEGNVTGILTGLNNFITMFYIFVQMIPNIGNDWLNWSEVASLWLCLPFILIFRPVYNRLTLDVHSEDDIEEAPSPPTRNESNDTLPPTPSTNTLNA